ncbi:jg13911 [Pararge aegeria aegeria]|uniref:Jg13911 protein n=1 Tax=Pararge aegeria aegeria TaxID=348720 RepID=A0A8S4SIH3_9NEOP|nr:jg13911 [Pararge aegeria aegeria]
MRRPQADNPFASSSPRVPTLPGRAPFRGSPTSPRYALKIIRIQRLAQSELAVKRHRSPCRYNFHPPFSVSRTNRRRRSHTRTISIAIVAGCLKLFVELIGSAFDMTKIPAAFLKQLWLTFGASLAFLIIGLVRGYSASAIPSIENLDSDLIQSSEQKSWIGAIPPLGAFVGSMCSGPLMQQAGRKRTLQLTAPLWAASWLVLGFAANFPLVLLGRLLSGLCVGFVLAPAQVYVSECCDPQIRGRLGSLPTLSMSLGILISYLAGSWLYWRHLAFLSAIFCAAMFVVLLPLPESPVWLHAKGLDNTYAIKWLHLSEHAIATVKPEESNEKVEEPKSLFTREVFFSSAVIKPLTVGFALLFFQQFSGIDAVIFFTVEIFQSAGNSIRRYLPIASLVLFMLGFSLGFGGLPFLLLGELFPTHYRSQLSAMGSAVNLLSMFTVIKSYHALEHVLTSAGTFWMYSCFCAVAFFFVLFMVPETKGKSLAEIEQHFRGKKEKENIDLQTIKTKF